MSNSYQRRHEAQRSAGDADQAEFMALRTGSVAVDSGLYDKRLADAMDDFAVTESPAMERWQQEDLQYDTAVGQVQEEIERRAAILGEAYPFTLDDGRLSYLRGNLRVYEFFLAICNSTTLTTGEHAHLPRVFERVAARLVSAYFGSRAQFIHTGSPRDPEVGVAFREAMRHVAGRTGEWAWGADDHLPEAQQQGDEGCDFVVCLDAADERQVGQLFVVGQCACGNNWQTKYSDLNIKRLGKWFNPLAVVDPVRSFATPHHIVDALLREGSREAGLFFDRARLTKIARQAPEGVLDETIRERMDGLIELTLN